MVPASLSKRFGPRFHSGLSLLPFSWWTSPGPYWFFSVSRRFELFRDNCFEPTRSLLRALHPEPCCCGPVGGGSNRPLQTSVWSAQLVSRSLDRSCRVLALGLRLAGPPARPPTVRRCDEGRSRHLELPAIAIERVTRMRTHGEAQNRESAIRDRKPRSSLRCRYSRAISPSHAGTCLSARSK
jgi:hypothetical protein